MGYLNTRKGHEWDKIDNACDLDFILPLLFNFGRGVELDLISPENLAPVRNPLHRISVQENSLVCDSNMS